MAVLAVIALPAYTPARASDTMTIDIPLHSKLSPVQRLNREGVEAVQKHQYDRAESLFLKAYLYDPSDPFTLNNLGYISELEGQLDRAQRFYQLALEQGCGAQIDMSSDKNLQGKPMMAAVDDLQNQPMRINRMNVEAMRLLAEDRGFEALSLLQQALSLDPQDPFTLNNLGVANETVGDYWNALKYYRAAADRHSSEPVVIAVDRAWRGRPVSDMAAASAKRLQERLQYINPDYARALMLSRRGVFAENENDWPAAKDYFLRAYSADPSDAFSLNNRGYVAEREGDLETAKFFYEKARRAQDAAAPVGMATDSAAEGKSLFAVASGSDHKVDGALDIYSIERRRQTGPIELTPRGSALEDSAPAAPPQPSPNAQPQPQQ
ncbi:MAG TPA: tetratricopeptide repeat protein [Terracidiphilus sp.]|nr:tetratricopeptide repeat protein [Terracidiphilus sp.]